MSDALKSETRSRMIIAARHHDVSDILRMLTYAEKQDWNREDYPLLILVILSAGCPAAMKTIADWATVGGFRQCTGTDEEKRVSEINNRFITEASLGVISLDRDRLRNPRILLKGAKGVLDPASLITSQTLLTAFYTAVLCGFIDIADELVDLGRIDSWAQGKAAIIRRNLETDDLDCMASVHETEVDTIESPLPVQEVIHNHRPRSRLSRIRLRLRKLLRL